MSNSDATLYLWRLNQPLLNLRLEFYTIAGSITAVRPGKMRLRENGYVSIIFPLHFLTERL